MKKLAERWPSLYGHQLGTVTGNLWGMNKGGGRFFRGIRSYISTQKKLDLLKAAGILFVEAHDTDILDLVLGEEGAAGYPTTMTESRKMEVLDQAVEKFISELQSRGMRCGMFTMNLFNSETEFAFGNISSQNESTRKLAIKRTLKGLEIAQSLNCVYVMWNGTDGVDGQCGAEHRVRNNLGYLAIVEILVAHNLKNGAKAVPFAFEPKPEEPRWKMYGGTASSVTTLKWRLAAEYPDIAHLFGGNLESAHSIMAKSDPAMDWGLLLESECLFHVHVNGQGDIAFDRDLAPDNPAALFDQMLQLHLAGYTGLVGIDVQPLTTDTDSQHAETILQTAASIRWAVAKAETADIGLLKSLWANHDQSNVNRYLMKHLYGIN